MTANEQADKLDEKLDKVDSFASPGYEDFDYSNFLNDAMIIYIKEFVSPLNMKRRSFEETELRSQGLSELIKSSSDLTVSNSQDGILPNGVFYDLPNNIISIILEDVISDKAHCITGSKIRPDVRVVSHDEYKRLIRNSFKRPYISDYEGLVWRMQFSRQVSTYDPADTATPKRVEILTDGTFDIGQYDIRYLEKPPEIVVDRADPTNQRNCVLDDFTHDTIVQIAEDLIRKSIGQGDRQPDVETLE